MAKNAQSFKVDSKKKVIVIYNNVEQAEGEKTVIEFYLKQGYTPKFQDKAKSKTVAEMRKELEKNDKEALKRFDEAYAKKEEIKDGNKVKVNGFHEACKVYNDWVKANKKAKSAEAETK